MRHLFRSYSDSEVLRAIRRGGQEEDKAIAYVMKANENSIYSYVLKNSGNRDSASTILIEGVSELIINIRTRKFKGNSSIGTYLFSICRALWLQKLKKDKRHVAMTKQKMNEMVSESVSIIDPDKLRIDLNRAMATIGESCKKVLEMWSVHYSMTEIASALNYKNAQIAMNKKNRCLTKLKATVSKNPELRERLINYLS